MKQLILAYLVGVLCPCTALCDTKMEAENADYANCKRITDSIKNNHNYNMGSFFFLHFSSQKAPFISFRYSSKGRALSVKMK